MGSVASQLRSMNKLLLTHLACLLLLVNGETGVENDQPTHYRPKPVQPSQPAPVLREERERIHDYEREKRTQTEKMSDKESFGYAWNIGSGVSYLKMHVGQGSSGNRPSGLEAAKGHVGQSLREGAEAEYRPKQERKETKKPGNTKGNETNHGKRDKHNAEKESQKSGSQYFTGGFGKYKHSFDIQDVTKILNGKGENNLNTESGKFITQESYDTNGSGKSSNGNIFRNYNIASIKPQYFEIPSQHNVKVKHPISGQDSTVSTLKYNEDKSGKHNTDFKKEAEENNYYKSSELGNHGLKDIDADRHSFNGKHKNVIDVKFSDSKHKGVDHSFRSGAENVQEVGSSDNKGYDYKGLNFDKYRFLTGSETEKNHEYDSPIQSSLNTEQRHGLEQPGGFNVENLPLYQEGPHYMHISEDDISYFPEGYFSNYGHGKDTNTKNVPFYHEKWNGGNSFSDQIQENDQNTDQDHKKGPSGDEDSEGPTTKYSQTNFNKDDTEQPGSFLPLYGEEGNYKSYFQTNDDKDSVKQNFYPFIDNNYFGGIFKGINSRGHLSHNGLNIESDNSFNKATISEQMEKIKEIQDSHYNGQIYGSGIYDVLDGNGNRGVEDSPWRGFNHHVQSAAISDGEGENRKSIENHFGLRNENGEHGEVQPNSYKYKESDNNGPHEDEQQSSNGAIGYSYSKSAVGHFQGDSHLPEPTWNEHIFGQKITGVPGFIQQNISPDLKDIHGNKQKAHFSNLGHSPQVDSFNEVKNINIHEQQANKEYKGDYESGHKKRDDRNSREAKSIDQSHHISDGGNSEHSIGHAGIEHLIAGSTIAKQSYESEDEEHSHLGNIDEEKQEEEIEGGTEEVKYEHNGPSVNFQYSLHKEPEVREVTKAIPIQKEIKIPVPHPVRHPILIPVPVRVMEPYPIKIPVPVTVEKTVQVPVEKVVHYPVEKPVPMKVFKEVPVPVPKPYPVKVPVYKYKYIHHTKKKHE